MQATLSTRPAWALPGAKARRGVDKAASAPPVGIPAGHVGPYVIPATGRMVYWTGRVAIGLRHQPQERGESVTQSALWIQRLLTPAMRAV